MMISLKAVILRLSIENARHSAKKMAYFLCFLWQHFMNQWPWPVNQWLCFWWFMPTGCAVGRNSLLIKTLHLIWEVAGTECTQWTGLFIIYSAFVSFQAVAWQRKEKSIIFDDEADIQLLIEISGAIVNPYSHPKEWKNIAENFTHARKLKIPATARWGNDAKNFWTNGLKVRKRHV